MASTRPCLAQLSRLCLNTLKPISPCTFTRFLSSTAPLAKEKRKETKKDLKGTATKGVNPQKNKKKGAVKAVKKKARTTFLANDIKDAEKFSLCDAMRYIRAFEVGQKPSVVKYEMAVRLKTLKNGPVVRNTLRLPHPVKTDLRICVICPPDSKYAESARAAGATLVGEDEVFQAVKEGRIEFDRCLCQTNSLAALNKAGLGRVLGPKGLMPSTKLGTVVKDPSLVIKDLVGGAQYREKTGVVRMAVGQLGFTPEEVQKNIKTFMESLKKDIGMLSDRINKDIIEVVLSSTNAPGFTLNGNFLDPDSKVTPKELSTL